MKYSLEDLESWLQTPSEYEALEFKEARNNYSVDKLINYCVAISNEGGGHLIFGVSDQQPRQVVGSNLYLEISDQNAIKAYILQKLQIRIELTEIFHPNGRVIVFDIPGRPSGHPVHIDGRYLMRLGESIVLMTQDVLKSIFAEGHSDWADLSAKENLDEDDVVALLDTQAFFDFLKLPYPSSRNGVIEKLKNERLISFKNGLWLITNIAAILFAKDLSTFSNELARKGVRVVVYEGEDKTLTKEDKLEFKGYAVAFISLLEFVHSLAPLNKSVEQVVREEVKMFPKQALRELIANALVHQDFLASGMSVMIEMYSDRVEISNPGIPPIKVERFIDDFRSRNERLANLMRRFGICEEKGSGVDKVIHTVELFQLPPPDFRVSDHRTTAILFAHQDFSKMSKDDRVRACYQHCCLMYVSNKKMSNQSLRERFGLPESKVATVSTLIALTKDLELIKADESETLSTRYAKYVPFWAN
jgi:ATP-dependent DNA helicase RecG